MPYVQHGRVTFVEEERLVLQPFLQRLRARLSPTANSADGSASGEGSHTPTLQQLTEEATAALKEVIDPKTLEKIPDLGKVCSC